MNAPWSKRFGWAGAVTNGQINNLLHDQWVAMRKNLNNILTSIRMRGWEGHNHSIINTLDIAILNYPRRSNGLLGFSMQLPGNTKRFCSTEANNRDAG